MPATIPTDNSKGDPLRVSSTKRMCASCRYSAPLEDFVRYGKDGKSYGRDCKDCRSEQHERREVYKEKTASTDLARTVAGVIDRVQHQKNGIAPDSTKLLENVIARVHEKLTALNDPRLGAGPQETMGNVIADCMLEANEIAQNYFLKFKYAKLISDMHGTVTRHKAPAVDLSDLTDADVRSLLLPIAQEWAKSDPEAVKTLLKEAGIKVLDSQEHANA